MVQPEQQRATVQQSAELIQNGDGILRAEVPQRAAWEKTDASFTPQTVMVRQGIQSAVIAADAKHQGVLVPLSQRAERGLQSCAADVQGHEGSRAQRMQQRIHLAGGADSELHYHSLANSCGDLCRLLFEQGDLRPGDGVFGLVADLGEQP